MRSDIENSSRVKLDAMTNVFQIEDEQLLSKIGRLYGEMERLGEGCADAVEFESKFASSPLYSEYMGLFMELPNKCKPVRGKNKPFDFSQFTLKNVADAVVQVAETDARRDYQTQRWQGMMSAGHELSDAVAEKFGGAAGYVADRLTYGALSEVDDRLLASENEAAQQRRPLGEEINFCDEGKIK